MIFTLHLSNHCEYLQTMSHLVFSVFCFIPRDPQCEEENHSGINRKEERGKGLSSLQPLYTLALLITFACISMCIFSARAHLRTVCLPLQKNKKTEPTPFLSPWQQTIIWYTWQNRVLGDLTGATDWPTYDRSISTVNHAGLKCLHVAADRGAHR